MQKLIILIIVLCSFLIVSVHLDCGCSSNNRQPTVAPLTLEKGEEKVCEKNARANNKYYRDYYPERDERQLEAEPTEVGMALITGGDYMIGTNQPHFPEDHEGPERPVVLQDFYIDKYEVSNADFQKFTESTGHVTEAESFGDSFLFKSLLSPAMQKEYEDYRVVNALWWYKVKNVSWHRPNGPTSDLTGIADHPVVHVSWNDAVAYCKWLGKRLPTEAEWEVACRGGKKGKLFPWGNKLMAKDQHWTNIWQGEFPDQNTLADGYLTTCPVTEFRQNSYDLYNMVGNVWEWTADLWDRNELESGNVHRVKKGGSYLCHKSYCYRYRCASRSQNTADSSSGNLGFRCAKTLL